MHSFYRYRKFFVVFVFGLSSGFFLSFWVFRYNDSAYYYAPDNFPGDLSFDMTVQETQIWSDFKDDGHQGIYAF